MSRRGRFYDSAAVGSPPSLTLSPTQGFLPPVRRRRVKSLLLLRTQEVHYATLKVFHLAKLTCTKVFLPSRVCFTAFSPSLLLLLRSSVVGPRMTSLLIIVLMNCPPEGEWKTSILNSYGIFTVLEYYIGPSKKGKLTVPCIQAVCSRCRRIQSLFSSRENPSIFRSASSPLFCRSV